MAEKKQSKLRYDDFIANVQPDPGKPVATTMLSASSGAAKKDTRAYKRIHRSETGTTCPEDDSFILQKPFANSKLGGSHVWIKADAQIKPGSAAATAAAAQPAVAITPQPTPATHCFICPPPHHSPATICTVPGHCPPNILRRRPSARCMPTARDRCSFICPPRISPPGSNKLIIVQRLPADIAAHFAHLPLAVPDADLHAYMAAPIAGLPHTAATV